MSGRGGFSGRGRGRGAGLNGSNRPVCRFFLNNTCSFGSRCRNYHPPPNRPSQRQCPNDNWQLANRNSAIHGAGNSNASGSEMSLNDFGSPETDLFTSLFSVAPDSSATEHLPTPRVRFLHPEPSANVTPANRIPDDALLTRAVPPDELDEDDLEDGEIDEEDYESDLDYNDLYQDDAQDMEDYMLALGSDDDDFSEYGDVQFQFGQQAMLNNNDSGDQLWDELHRGLMRGGFQRQERVAAQPNNAPAAATGELNVADIQSFATRMTQSIESKDAEIKQLKEEVERLKEIIESDNEKKDGRLCTLKCGVCLDIKKATQFSVNSPCGHCFCKTCNDSLKGNRDSKCPKCRARVHKQTAIFV